MIRQSGYGIAQMLDYFSQMRVFNNKRRHRCGKRIAGFRRIIFTGIPG